jgi:hypothetical protein
VDALQVHGAVGEPERLPCLLVGLDQLDARFDPYRRAAGRGERGCSIGGVAVQVALGGGEGGLLCVDPTAVGGDERGQSGTEVVV